LSKIKIENLPFKLDTKAWIMRKRKLDSPKKEDRQPQLQSQQAMPKRSKTPVCQTRNNCLQEIKTG